MIVTGDWRAFVSHIVRLVGQAYGHGQLMSYPLAKVDRWDRIDQKLTDKFGTQRNPRQRSYRISQGKANYYLVRWQHLCVILRSTKGEPDEAAEQGEHFLDLRHSPLLLPIGEYLTLSVRLERTTRAVRNEHPGKDWAATLRLSRECYRDTKTAILVAARSNRARECRRLIENLNGIPPHRGTVEQARRLEQFARRQLRRNSIQLPASWVTIRTRRLPRRVLPF